MQLNWDLIKGIMNLHIIFRRDLRNVVNEQGRRIRKRPDSDVIRFSLRGNWCIAYSRQHFRGFIMHDARLP